MMQLRAAPPAKVNLALAVTGRRADGYHTLRSIFLRLALHDELEVDVDEEATTDSLVVDGAELGAGPDNLVLRAAASLRADVGGPLPALRFRLHKRIPVAAGLGGGSTDGSAALDLAQAAWGVRLHPSERLDAALRLGADVPFFSAGHPACLVSGVGERLQPLGAPDPEAGIVLVTLPERLSTSAVFAAFDAGPKADSVAGGRVDELARLLSGPIDGTTLAMTTDRLRDANDLWPPASRLSPSLAGAREAASAFLGRSLLLTGSGPTLFAVYPSAKAAARAADHLRAEDLPQLHGATILATSTT
jgi:4-diphosphocytidyl-2-C-methyl-D-erythritol kinase